MCPPCIVFPYIRPPRAVVNSMPQEWCLGRSETGWMKGDIFFEYITNEFHNWVVENNIKKPVLLLVDGHKSHMSLILNKMCEQMEITLYALPPNTTHILQPADVSVFAPVKTYWKSTVREFLSKPENFNSAVTKTSFCKLLSDALKHPNIPNNIKNGFKRCGLYPFDANSPDYTKCVRNTLENVQAVNQQSQDNVTHSDIKRFKKVLKHLKPTLKEKNIDIRTITKAVNRLKKSLPAEVGFAEISIETESEKSHMELSIEKNRNILNPIDRELVPTKETTISSFHEDAENKSDEANSDPTVRVQSVSAEIHSAPKQFIEPCTSNITTSNRTLASSKIDCDEITVYPDEYSTLDTNKNDSFPDLSLSTLHLSGSYLDVGSTVSLDDILILPLQDITSTHTILSVEKKTTIKELTPELPLTSSTASTVSLPSFLNTDSLVQPASAGTQKKTSDPFKHHLMLPKISNKARKENQRTSAAISSAAWRKYYEDKEQIKSEKQEAIRKRKLERIEKQEQKKTLKRSETIRKTAPK
ncbi:inner centromere protein A-like [Onthophagus taurus]|uniref:inner centromere protein A-like n=1 Tax=Onthophagus taurus TaxID=166361 RepID=UPI0039BDB73A